jgi:hypothetical protein
MSKDTNHVEVDYLTEDTPIPGQEYGVYSFLSPEGIKGCNVRAFKNRGNFSSYEAASAHAEKIRNEEPAFHVFVGENFKWTAFDPDPNLVKDNNNYYEPKLQELMKGTLANQEKAKQVESQRKRDMIEEAIKEEIKKKSVRNGDDVKERLRKKLNKKAENEKEVDINVSKQVQKAVSNNSSSVDLTEDEVKEKKENVKKLNENISTIDENLEKMKKLYADLQKKKQSVSASNTA